VKLASLVQQKYSVRSMALTLSRSPSAIGRELRRNAQPAGCASAPVRACAVQRPRQSHVPQMPYRNGILFGPLRRFLGERWSPEQLALTLARLFPKGHEHRVSHQTICNCICAQPVGKLKRELIATLRHAHNKRGMQLGTRPKGPDPRHGEHPCAPARD
jgi:IS30 family transposase